MEGINKGNQENIEEGIKKLLELKKGWELIQPEEGKKGNASFLKDVGEIISFDDVEWDKKEDGVGRIRSEKVNDYIKDLSSEEKNILNQISDLEKIWADAQYWNSSNSSIVSLRVPLKSSLH